MKVPDWLKQFGHFVLKILFPAHHRKITTIVVSVGAALAIDGWLLGGVLQYLVRLVMAHFTGTPLPQWDDVSGSDTRWQGVIILAMGLIYSAVVLWIETVVAQNAQAGRAQNILKRDRTLYLKFKEQFGTDSPLESFVCHHPFGISWPSENWMALHRFVEKWRAPERKYVDKDLAADFTQLLDDMAELVEHLAREASPLMARTEFDCIFDPSLHCEFDTPKHIDLAIKKANDLALKIKEERRAFILHAEGRFAAIADRE